CLRSAEQTGTVERLFGLDLLGDGRLFDAAIHRSGKVALIEVEPHSAESYAQHTGMLRPLMEALQRFSDVADLSEAAAASLKQLLGFDRVMVYRFHPDLSGEVIAEAKEPSLGSFLHLRYPKSDIPQQ